MRYALLVVTLFVGTVFVLMLGINGYLSPQSEKETQAVMMEETVPEETTSETTAVEENNDQ